MQKSKANRVIIVAVGDKQAGHSGALVNPETQLPVFDLDEKFKRVVAGYDTPKLSSIQKRLWKWHEQDIQNVKDIAGKDPIVYLGMGDETQGGIFKDDLSDNSMATQWLYSYFNMLPWLEMKQVKSAYFVQGTSVHLWGAGDTETVLIHNLKRDHPEKRIEMTQHWELTLDGFRMDVAHHGAGAGTREWTKGNVLRLYTRSLIQKLHDNGQPIPDLVLRAHHHQPICETVTLNLDEDIIRTESWITPPYCFIGSHAQKVTQSISTITVGMLAFEIVNGKLMESYYKPFWHTVDLRVREEIVI